MEFISNNCHGIAALLGSRDFSLLSKHTLGLSKRKFPLHPDLMTHHKRVASPKQRQRK